MRRAARKVEKPRLYLARGLEHLRLALKDLRKLDEGDLATPDARQALRDGLNTADGVFSEARLLAKQVEEEAAA